MPRRGRFDKHPLLPDAKYNSLLVSRFINKLMMRGKIRRLRAATLQR